MIRPGGTAGFRYGKNSGIADNPGMGILCEGVETAMQAEFPKRCGCMPAQGYFYGRPAF